MEKTTLLEAIVVCLGFNPEGGSFKRDPDFQTRIGITNL